MTTCSNSVTLAECVCCYGEPLRNTQNQDIIEDEESGGTRDANELVVKISDRGSTCERRLIPSLAGPQHAPMHARSCLPARKVLCTHLFQAFSVYITGQREAYRGGTLNEFAEISFPANSSPRA